MWHGTSGKTSDIYRFMTVKNNLWTNLAGNPNGIEPNSGSNFKHFKVESYMEKEKEYKSSSKTIV